MLTLAVEVAIAMRLDGHVADARDLTLEALVQLRQHYGDDHEVALLCANLYGADLRTRGQFAEALELDLGLLPRFERVFGSDHERTFNVRNNLAAAIRLGRETYAGCQDALGADHPDTLMAAANLAMDEAAAGNQAEAERLLADVLSRYERTLTAEHPEARGRRPGYPANG